MKRLKRPLDWPCASFGAFGRCGGRAGRNLFPAEIPRLSPPHWHAIKSVSCRSAARRGRRGHTEGRTARHEDLRCACIDTRRRAHALGLSLVLPALREAVGSGRLIDCGRISTSSACGHPSGGQSAAQLPFKIMGRRPHADMPSDSAVPHPVCTAAAMAGRGVALSGSASRGLEVTPAGALTFLSAFS